MGSEGQKSGVKSQESKVRSQKSKVRSPARTPSRWVARTQVEGRRILLGSPGLVRSSPFLAGLETDARSDARNFVTRKANRMPCFGGPPCRKGLNPNCL